MRRANEGGSAVESREMMRLLKWLGTGDDWPALVKGVLSDVERRLAVC